MFELKQSRARIDKKVMRLKPINYLDGDSVYLILKLLGPVELISILLQKEDLCLENADIINSLPEIFW